MRSRLEPGEITGGKGKGPPFLGRRPLGMLQLQSPQPSSGPGRKNGVRTLELVERNVMLQSGLLFEFLGDQLAVLLYRL
jgi:hypothetical protein